MENPLKFLNYDDFYKFSISGGLILFILGSLITVYDIANIPSDPLNQFLRIPSIAIYFTFSVIGGGAFVYGVYHWNKNQQVNDEMLRLERDERKINVKEKELRYKKLLQELNPEKRIISGSNVILIKKAEITPE